MTAKYPEFYVWLKKYLSKKPRAFAEIFYHAPAKFGNNQQTFYGWLRQGVQAGLFQCTETRSGQRKEYRLCERK